MVFWCKHAYSNRSRTMYRGISVMACLFGMAVATWGDEKEKDPVREKLFSAKVAYDNDMRQFRKQAEDWFDKREEAARKAGDKKAVDLIKDQREAFDEYGELPRAAPAA